MPEVGEVKKAAQKLQRWISASNLSLQNIIFTETGKYREENGPPKGWAEFEAKLPMTSITFEPRGKKIIASGTAADGTSLYMIMGLGMEGRFSLTPTKHNCYTFELETEEGELRCVYFNDSRHFANIFFFVGDDEYAKGLKSYAPSVDPLSSDISIEEWTTLIRNPRRKKAKIITFFLDQKSISGIGNYLSAEILFAARIRPNRELASLTDDEIKLLKDQTDRLVKLSYESSGQLVYTNAEAGPGKGFKCYVYLRKTISVRKKDGTIVQHRVHGTKYFGKRTTYWSSALQR